MDWFALLFLSSFIERSPTLFFFAVCRLLWFIFISTLMISQSFFHAFPSFSSLVIMHSSFPLDLIKTFLKRFLEPATSLSKPKRNGSLLALCIALLLRFQSFFSLVFYLPLFCGFSCSSSCRFLLCGYLVPLSSLWLSLHLFVLSLSLSLVVSRMLFFQRWPCVRALLDGHQSLRRHHVRLPHETVRNILRCMSKQWGCALCCLIFFLQQIVACCPSSAGHCVRTLSGMKTLVTVRKRMTNRQVDSFPLLFLPLFLWFVAFPSCLLFLFILFGETLVWRFEGSNILFVSLNWCVSRHLIHCWAPFNFVSIGPTFSHLFVLVRLLFICCFVVVECLLGGFAYRASTSSHRETEWWLHAATQEMGRKSQKDARGNRRSRSVLPTSRASSFTRSPSTACCCRRKWRTRRSRRRNAYCSCASSSCQCSKWRTTTTESITRIWGRFSSSSRQSDLGLSCLTSSRPHKSSCIVTLFRISARREECAAFPCCCSAVNLLCTVLTDGRRHSHCGMMMITVWEAGFFHQSHSTHNILFSPCVIFPSHFLSSFLLFSWSTTNFLLSYHLFVFLVFSSLLSVSPSSLLCFAFADHAVVCDFMPSFSPLPLPSSFSLLLIRSSPFFFSPSGLIPSSFSECRYLPPAGLTCVCDCPPCHLSLLPPYSVFVFVSFFRMVDFFLVLASPLCVIARLVISCSWHTLFCETASSQINMVSSKNRQ